MVLVGMVDSGDEAAKFDGVLWQEKGWEDDVSRHIACGTKLEILARSAKALYLCRVLASGGRRCLPWLVRSDGGLGLSRPNASHKSRPSDVASGLSETPQRPRARFRTGLSLLINPTGQESQLGALSALAIQAYERFREPGDISDIHLAVQAAQRGMMVIPDTSSHLMGHLNNLGVFLERRHGGQARWRIWKKPSV